MDVRFEDMTKEQLLDICNKYKRYIKYNMEREATNIRDDIDDKQVYKEFLSGKNYNKLATENNMSPAGMKKRIERYEKKLKSNSIPENEDT